MGKSHGDYVILQVLERVVLFHCDNKGRELRVGPLPSLCAAKTDSKTEGGSSWPLPVGGVLGLLRQALAGNLPGSQAGWLQLDVISDGKGRGAQLGAREQKQFS